MKRLIGLLLVAVMAAGCTTVPTGRRVLSPQAEERGEPFDDPYVRILPVPPQPGATETEIVTGFLTASGSFDNDHHVARQYLAPKTVWQPGIGTIVYDSLQSPMAVDHNTDGTVAEVTLTGTQQGKIGADGQYVASRQPFVHSFELRKRRGQWRITELPGDLRHVLLLSRGDVARTFRTLSLYYFALDGPQLVPDPVSVPLGNRRDLATQLVQGLVRGPTSWLKPAVHTGFPPNTRLREPIRVQDGVARVDLSREAHDGNLRTMSAQLMWTLRQLPEVERMTLAIEGRTMSAPGTGGEDGVQSPGDWSSVNPDGTPSSSSWQAYLQDKSDQLARYEEKPWRVHNDAKTPRLDRPAISMNERSVAALSEDGRQVFVGGIGLNSESLREVLNTSLPNGRFTPPSWDGRGHVWTVETYGSGSRLWVIEKGRKAVQVAGNDWKLADRKVIALRVARDGARAAVIVENGARSEIRIGRIVRQPGPLRAEAFLPISAELDDTTDLAWRNANELAVLGRGDSSVQPQPHLVLVGGGQIRPLGSGAPSAMNSIAAAPGVPILVGASGESDQGEVCRLREEFGTWECNVEGSDPTYPG